MHDYDRRADLLSQTKLHLYDRMELVLQALIIVQTIIYHCSKVFTTDQTREQNLLGAWAADTRLTRSFAMASITGANYCTYP